MESVSTDNYIVEKITGIAINKDNKRYYKIQWAPSWEKEENLIGCGELIKNFLLEQANNINVELQQKTGNDIKQEKVLRSINDAINNESTVANGDDIKNEVCNSSSEENNQTSQATNTGNSGLKTVTEMLPPSTTPTLSAISPTSSLSSAATTVPPIMTLISSSLPATCISTVTMPSTLSTTMPSTPLATTSTFTSLLSTESTSSLSYTTMSSSTLFHAIGQSLAALTSVSPDSPDSLTMSPTPSVILTSISSSIPCTVPSAVPSLISSSISSIPCTISSLVPSSIPPLEVLVDGNMNCYLDEVRSQTVGQNFYDDSLESELQQQQLNKLQPQQQQPQQQMYNSNILQAILESVTRSIELQEQNRTDIADIKKDIKKIKMYNDMQKTSSKPLHYPATATTTPSVVSSLPPMHAPMAPTTPIPHPMPPVDSGVDSEGEVHDGLLTVAPPSTKKKENQAQKFVKRKLGEVFNEEELCNGAFTTCTKRYKGKHINSVALSPGRLNRLLASAKEQFPTDYENMNVASVINEKCRKTRLYVNKQK